MTGLNAHDHAHAFITSLMRTSIRHNQVPCEQIWTALRQLIATLYATYKPTGEAEDAFQDALIKCCLAVIQATPPMARFVDTGDDEPSNAPTIPLHTVVNLPALIEDMSAPFMLPFSKRIFPNLNLLLSMNLARASKQPYPIQGKIVSPHEYEGDDIIHAYLGDTPLYNVLFASIPFSIPRKAYQEHGAIFAPTGHGKTQTLGSLIHGFLQEPNPPGMFILDSRGKMLKEIETLDLFHPDTGRLKDRLVIIDPEDDQPPALNLFKLGVSDTRLGASVNDLFDYLFTALDAGLTAKQGVSVDYLLRLMNALPNPTIDTFLQVMEADPKELPYARQIATLPPHVQSFFKNQFFNKAAMGQTRQQIARRLYTVIGNDTFRRMFSAPDNRFNAYKAMQEKKVVLINTAAQFLGERTSAVFGRFFIAMTLAAALQRKDNERDLCLLIVDEASEYFDVKTERILSQARQYGLGLLFATQFIEQMPDRVKEAVNGNTAIKMAGPVSYKDATALGREMYTSGEFLRSMKKLDGSHADFACHVRGLTPHAIKLTIPYLALENAPKMDPGARAENRLRNRTRVGSQEHHTTHDSSPATPPHTAHPHATTPDRFVVKPGKEW